MIRSNIPLKKRIRKYLVRNFIGHHRFKFAGHRFRIRRHVRMGLISVMLQFMIVMTISALECSSMLKIIGLVPIPILAYAFVDLFYFHAWPVQLIELDDEQIEDWDDDDDGMRPTPTIKVT